MIEPAYTTKIKVNHSHSKPSCYTFGRSHADCHHCEHVSAIFIYSVPAKLAHLLQARASALEEFDSIMTDSASSMKADAPLVTSADKTAWWRKRLELDQRMAALLQHLDEDWLGPWKYDATFGLITVPCSHVDAACAVSLCTMFAAFWLSWASYRTQVLAYVCVHCHDYQL